MKERVTLTLETDVLKRVDARVDGYSIKNRSHAVELLLVQALGADVPKTAVVLAAGKDTLKAAADELPLSMHLVQGKPILEHVIDLLKQYGINHVILCVAYKKEVIKSHFRNGEDVGVHIDYVEEKEPTGTASILRLARRFITGPFVLTNGDELKNVDIEDMYRFHKRVNACVTIGLTTTADPSAYGVAHLRGNKILEFLEKPSKSSGHLINAGIYICEPSLLEKITAQDNSLVRHTLPRIAKEELLYGYPFDGQWFDTSTTQGYMAALKEWKGFVQKAESKKR